MARSALFNAIRWIVALPAGVLGAALVSFPVHLFVMVNFGGWAMEPLIEVGDPETLREIEYLLQAAFGPFAFVYCAARTVPKYNRLVSVLLAGTLVVGVPLVALWWNSNVMAAGHGVLLEHGLLRVSANVIGSGVAIWMICRRGRTTAQVDDGLPGK
jgi:hypothetical protein